MDKKELVLMMPERCLSYDEKPLMLFQKLKEGGMKPVFMLRHIVSPCSPDRLDTLSIQLTSS